MIFMKIPVRYRTRAGLHLLSTEGKSLKTTSVMPLKVPRQKVTVRGPAHSKAKTRLKIDLTALCVTIAVKIIKIFATT